MISAVIFDMDGTLIDAADWHFQALNEALSIFGEEITIEEHLGEFNGLPTNRKLQMLSERNRIPKNIHSMISRIKQERTLRIVATKCYPRIDHLLLMSYLKERGCKIGVATNSIRNSAETMLRSAGMLPFIDILITNEDVSRPKPDPEMYRVACERLGYLPEDCLVVEDHEYGIRAAIDAGCRVLKVENPNDLDSLRIQNELGAIS